ncbi:peptide n-acetyl-beta-D-glucosaminyl asparaginase amidase A domain-containing protein [Hirsutella rhossiliensis]|uniref:Peptide n-acetyl-beta-D-glucosaminyl asparaginase amidase A domain-containing protein n=1 Tax=Hirsutella rhossiliensis TaxID=111463 RepID=A0A9P8MNP9_9HYPO|nr:peptide n-acetyl-beta-D-glucosaminyl asparaginase amidase A domain-containing protein [Hirsutella rhossiliensis]KAH0958359.1 peptide n-acetyl-beta-D-glucosaminyl asparaginase amidase A domain-containing protein [Hirsutella rhossiliensis]
MTRLWWWLAFPLATAAMSGPARMRELVRSVQAPLELRAAGSGAEPLRCFQVTSPVLGPDGLLVGDQTVGRPPKQYRSCLVRLVEHVFANSYGKPYVGTYTPPDCKFGRVIFNLTVVSEGRQYDRLATLWAGDVEVWRTSTAEPKQHPGIVWTHIKDMTAYVSLWKEPQSIIFDLGNLVNERYTGSYNVTITATFFNEIDLPGPGGPPADRVIPVSARKSQHDLGSAWVYPEERAEDQVEMPRNIRRAVLSVAATGQAAEEFWWSNVPQQVADDLADVSLPGLGSFREVRVRIDDKLVGLTWPFPVIFTGGIAPPLHRPLVGLQAFDLGEHEVDITPWLGLICDGKPHNISLEVVAEHNTRAPSNWVLSAKVFVWLSRPGSVSGGELPRVNVSTPSYNLYLSTEPDKRIRYRQSANRSFYARGNVRIDNVRVLSEWRQLFFMDNAGYVGGGGDYQRINASYGGTDSTDVDRIPLYQRNYRYPVLTSYLTRRPRSGPYSMTLDANLTQGVAHTILGESAFPTGLEPFMYKMHEQKRGVELLTTRHGRAFYYQRNDGDSSGGFANLDQEYALGGRGFTDGEGLEFHGNPVLYKHNVSVVNETVVQDKQFVYKPDVDLPERGSGSSRFVVEDYSDQYAPVMADGLRGGSASFSAKHFGLEPAPAWPPIKEVKSSGNWKKPKKKKPKPMFDDEPEDESPMQKPERKN